MTNEDKELICRGLWALIEQEKERLIPGVISPESARAIHTIQRAEALMDELGHPCEGGGEL
tara:strand:+ start:843 stop:1025 length:183 start_codon:yes stop_codon:yes gene_type:complete